MIIKTKFSKDDEVHYIQRVEVYTGQKTCGICNSDGNVIIKKQLFRCPKCGGAKKMTNKKIVFEPRKVFVKNITVYVNKDGADINYQVIDTFGTTHHIAERKLFKSRSYAAKIANDKKAVMGRYKT